jgi:hypothetical protein
MTDKYRVLNLVTAQKSLVLRQGLHHTLKQVINAVDRDAR